MASYCSNCGTAFQNQDSFCSNCGFSNRPNEQKNYLHREIANQDESLNTPQSQKIKNKKLFVIFTVIATFAIGIGGYFTLNHESPYSSIINSNSAKASDLLNYAMKNGFCNQVNVIAYENTPTNAQYLANKVGDCSQVASHYTKQTGENYKLDIVRIHFIVGPTNPVQDRTINTVYGNSWSAEFFTNAVLHPDGPKLANKAMLAFAKDLHALISPNYRAQDYCNSSWDFINKDLKLLEDNTTGSLGKDYFDKLAIIKAEAQNDLSVCDKKYSDYKWYDTAVWFEADPVYVVKAHEVFMRLKKIRNFTWDEYFSNTPSEEIMNGVGGAFGRTAGNKDSTKNCLITFFPSKKIAQQAIVNSQDYYSAFEESRSKLGLTVWTNKDLIANHGQYCVDRLKEATEIR